MARLKILFADDQIPDKDIPSAELEQQLRARYPDAQPGFLRAFGAMRHAVSTLVDRGGYKVTATNTFRQALESIDETRFDIAIIDLNWAADKAVPRDERTNKGWDLCDEIEERNKRRPNDATFQIAYSSRFTKRSELAMQAANRGILPLFKAYTRASNYALLAAVRFVEANVVRRQADVNALGRSQAQLHELMNHLLSKPQTLPAEMLSRLREFLVERYNVEELKTLCADLSVDYDNLAGGAKESKARELVLYLQRVDRLTELMQIVQKTRP